MDDYIVLGDKTERVEGEYLDGNRLVIVRMFVGDKVFDEELEAHIDDLHREVLKRMRMLAKAPEHELLAEAEQPSEHPGHAITVPGHGEEA